MVSSAELLKQGRRDEFWQRYCGFFDLTIAEFMAIQERLLIEQLRTLNDSKLGRQIVGGEVPRTLNDFRRVVPFTTYDSYIPYLTEQREDMLAVKPTCWARTSGTTGNFPKWVPVSPEHYKQLARTLMTFLTLAGAKSKGDVIVEEGSDSSMWLPRLPSFLESRCAWFRTSFQCGSFRRSTKPRSCPSRNECKRDSLNRWEPVSTISSASHRSSCGLETPSRKAPAK